jgi:hypothetical protein
MRLLELVHDASTVGITSFRFLIGEIPAIAQSGLGEADLLRLRHDLLAVASEGGRLFRATSAMLRVLLSATLLEGRGRTRTPQRLRKRGKHRTQRWIGVPKARSGAQWQEGRRALRG